MSDLPPLRGSTDDRRFDIPSDEELEICLAAMSIGKAPGHDGIPVEIFKRIPTCKQEVFALVRAIWLEEDIPPDMVVSTFVMLFKNKGSQNDCTKYRMIGLLPTAYKLVSTLLLHRLRLECEGFLDLDQAGFRQKRGTRDQIIVLSEVLAQLQEEGQAHANAIKSQSTPAAVPSASGSPRDAQSQDAQSTPCDRVRGGSAAASGTANSANGSGRIVHPAASWSAMFLTADSSES